MEIERVTHIKYLGAWLNDRVDPDEEIRSRIEIARDAFKNFSSILCSRTLKLSLRLKVLRCYILASLLYAVETWTLKVSMMNKIEAFEMWCYRRILRLSWRDRVSNERVLRMLFKDRELLATVKRRKMEYLGHIVRGPKYVTLQTILQGKFEGKRRVGRKNLSWLRNIRTWTELPYEELVRTASDRESYRNLLDSL